MTERTRAISDSRVKGHLVMGCQSVCKAHGGATDSPSAGDNLHVTRGQNARTVGAQSGPEIVVLGGMQVGPTAGAEIHVGSNAEVRSVHMRMCAVRMKQIG